MPRKTDDEYNKVWQKISAKSNFVDPELAKKVYYGMLKAIVADLRNSGKCWLPDLGEFSLTDKRLAGIAGGGVRKALHFKGDYKLRGYFGLMARGEEDKPDKVEYDGNPFV